VSIGQNVKRVREEQRYTQTEIARRCGVTPAAISGLEHGEFNPSTPLLVKLAKALDVSIEELVEEPAVPLSKAPEAGLSEALTGQIVEVQNRYRDRRAGLELLCERWERQLDSLGEDLTRETLEEMSLVGSYVTDFFVQAAVDETVEIWVVLSSATPGRAESRVVVDSAAIATAIRSSSMKPVLDRWERLGGEIYRRGVERFGEDAARNVIRLGDPARPTASVDELALRRAEKLQQRRAS
jgi:putative transcriptional regulator